MKQIRPTIITAAAVLLTLTLPATAPAERRGVLIVKSDDLPQYAAPIPAFRGSGAAHITVVDMQGSRAQGEAMIGQALETDRPAAVFALGAQAAWLSRRMLPDTPLVFAMVLGWERYGLDNGPVTGVAIEMPARDALTRIKLVFPHLP